MPESDRVGIRLRRADETKIVLPELPVAAVLKRLVEHATSKYHKNFDTAVITVPAQFTHPQRVALAGAAKVAGFDKVHFINEPTAAGLAAGIQMRAQERVEGDGALRFVVIDLGELLPLRRP